MRVPKFYSCGSIVVKERNTKSSPSVGRQNKGEGGEGDGVGGGGEPPKEERYWGPDASSWEYDFLIIGKSIFSLYALGFL